LIWIKAKYDFSSIRLKAVNESLGADYFASNPLRPADGTAHEISQEPDWSSVSVREKLFCSFPITNLEKKNTRACYELLDMVTLENEPKTISERCF